jgi:hypothetical protein
LCVGSCISPMRVQIQLFLLYFLRQKTLTCFYEKWSHVTLSKHKSTMHRACGDWSSFCSREGGHRSSLCTPYTNNIVVRRHLHEGSPLGGATPQGSRALYSVPIVAQYNHPIQRQSLSSNTTHAVLRGRLSNFFVGPLTIRNIDILPEPKSSILFHSAQTKQTPRIDLHVPLSRNIVYFLWTSRSECPALLVVAPLWEGPPKAAYIPP